MIGSHIKMLRNERHLSQAQLAAELGVNRMTVNHYEQGKRAPDIDFVRHVADYFGVTVEFLMGLSEYRYKNDVVVSHDRAETLFRVMEKLPQRKTQEAVAELIETLDKASKSDMAEEILYMLQLFSVQMRNLLYEDERMRQDLPHTLEALRRCGVPEEQIHLVAENRLKAAYGTAFHIAGTMRDAIGDVVRSMEKRMRKLVDDTLRE